MYSTCFSCTDFFLFAFLLHILTQDARKMVNKCITDQYRELAMWSIALLINTSTWVDFKRNWQLICLVFLQIHHDENHINEEYQDALLNRIGKIKSDPDIRDAMKSSSHDEDGNKTEAYHSNEYDFDRHEDDTDQVNRKFSRSSRKKV
jgi:hypothetical protein